MIEALLVTAALPAVATGLGLAASRLGPRPLRGSRWVVGLGLAVGLIASFVLVAGRPSLPPRDVLHWIPVAVGAGWILGLLDELRTRRAALRLGAHALLLVGLVAALLGPLASRWQPSRSAVALVALAGAAAAGWWLLDRPAGRQTLSFALVPLTVTSASYSFVMLFSGSAKCAQLGGALAAGLAVLALAALLDRLGSVAGAPLAVAWTALSGLLAHALLYTEVHPACILLLFAGLTGSALLGRVPFLGLLPRRRRLALGLTAVLLPAAAALALAYSRFEPSPYGG